MNTGSFMAGNPQSQDAVQMAMQMRGMGASPVPALSQTGQGAPAMPPPAPTTQAPMPSQPPQGAMMAPNDPESQLIVKALSSRLSAISSVEKSEVEGLSAPVGG